MLLESLTEPLGAGAVVLLAFLLFASTIIALIHFRRVNSPSYFLIADHEAKWYDFVASQIGYLTSLGSGVVLFTALAYTYGPVTIPILVVGYLIAAAVIFLVLWRSREVREYLLENYGLPNFIASNFAEGKGRRFISGFSSFIIALVYWGIFAVEIVALKIIFDVVFPDQSSLPILFVSIGLVILYVSLGGYLSSMRSDGFQTLVLIIFIAFVSFIVLPEQFGAIVHVPSIFSSEIFAKAANVSSEEVWGFGVAYILLAAVFLLISQDVWSRSSAVSGRKSLTPALVGILASTLGYLIPTVALALWGLYMFGLDPNLTSSQAETIPALLINKMAGKAPVGLLLPAFVMVAISTADTAILTSTQAINNLKGKWVNTLTKCRVWTAVLGLTGLVIALLSPDIVSTVFGLASILVAFLPLIIARMLNRGRKTGRAIVVLVVGAILGLVAVIIGGDMVLYAPILILILSLVLYPLLQILRGGTKNAA